MFYYIVGEEYPLWWGGSMRRHWLCLCVLGKNTATVCLASRKRRLNRLEGWKIVWAVNGFPWSHRVGMSDSAFSLTEELHFCRG